MYHGGEGISTAAPLPEFPSLPSPATTISTNVHRGSKRRASAQRTSKACRSGTLWSMHWRTLFGRRQLHALMPCVASAFPAGRTAEFGANDDDWAGPHRRLITPAGRNCRPVLPQTGVSKKIFE